MENNRLSLLSTRRALMTMDHLAHNQVQTLTKKNQTLTGTQIMNYTLQHIPLRRHARAIKQHQEA